VTFPDTPDDDAAQPGRTRLAWTAPAARVFQQAGLLARELARHLWRQARDRGAPGWPPAWLTYAGVTMAVGVLLLVIVPFLSGILDAIVRLLQGVTQWLYDRAFAEVVTGPVHRYLLEHAAGLPVTGETLWWTWCLATATVFLLAVLGASGARWGWAVLGVLTTAMVAAGTVAASRWVAAGVTVVWWCLLSVLAYHRRSVKVRLIGRRPLVTVAAPGPADGSVTAPPGSSTARTADDEPRDHAVDAARRYERLLRREMLAEQVYGAGSATWTVTGTGGHGFTAVDTQTGQLAVGRMLAAEAVPGLLAALSTPPGAPPAVRWDVPPPAPLQLVRMPMGPARDLPGTLEDFIRAGETQRAAVREAILHLRSGWDLDRLDEQITERAAALNRSHPFPGRGDLLPQTGPDDDDPGCLSTYAWVDPVTVVGGNAAHWNDFDDHRPDVVGLIIEELLRTDDIDAALIEILGEGNGLHLTQTPGPAGPLHQVGINGTHRTHALRILGVPLLAAEVYVPSLPLRLTPRDVAAQNYRQRMGAVWRALIDQNLLAGEVYDTAFGPVVETHHIAAPWLLRDPDTAAAVSVAYHRIYPGSLQTLGIPLTAVTTGANWLRWLGVR